MEEGSLSPFIAEIVPRDKDMTTALAAHGTVIGPEEKGPQTV